MALITRDLLGNHHSAKQLPFHDLTKPEKDHLRKRQPSNTNEGNDLTVSKLQDLNQPPLNILEDTHIDLNLNLVTLSSSSQPYTLGNVKHALERAEREHTRKRLNSMSKSSTTIDADEAYATGCPSCLLYVLISSSNPKCPRCNMTLIPSPTTIKKPRIDLNITI
ncbi:hypothetical protein QVD17_27086 [Tagetes erecta]|uniref:GIR1-like zinc ribbon domain-containing protein n=1 Tax=Tagetes erecta TaxID=13708 RepID=A0AAD8K7S2_TARER|nr:hypothetical protein QVD17_27086 [Tagetes erecta]